MADSDCTIHGEIDYLPAPDIARQNAEGHWQVAHELLDELLPLIGAERHWQLSDAMNSYGTAIANELLSRMVRAAYGSTEIGGQPAAILLDARAADPVGA